MRSALLLILYLSVCTEAAGIKDSILGAALGAPTNDGRKHYTLKMESCWQLNAPKQVRFDASGLVFSQGRLLTVNDRGPELFEIVLGTNSAAELKPTDYFPHPAVIKALHRSWTRLDC